MSSPPPEVSAAGDIFLTIVHDTSISYGVKTRSGERLLIKVLAEQYRPRVVAAFEFHRAVKHPAIVDLRRVRTLANGSFALSFPFVEGENLNDPAVSGALPRAHPNSASSIFHAQETEVILGCLDAIIGAHVAIAHQGYVAVDFYDGSIIWDFQRLAVRLVDFELYRQPYRLDVDRQCGSNRFMAPEEYVRGSWIDQVSTVFTLGRTVQVLLGPRGRERLIEPLLAVVQRAVAAEGSARYPSVSALATAWFQARMLGSAAICAETSH